MKTRRKTTKALLWGGVTLLFTLIPVSHGVAQTCVPPPSGLVSWWPGDGNANDIRDGNDGTLANGATFEPGLVGQAFSFDGVDDYVQVAASSILDLPSGDFSVEGWVRFDDADREVAIVSHGGFGCSPRGGWAFRRRGNNLLHFSFDGPTGVNFRAVFSSFPISSGVFHHLAVTKEGSLVKIYIDGLLDTSGSNFSTYTPISQTLEIGSGRHLNAGCVPESLPLKGLVDELELYNRALTASEIQAIFDAGSAGKCKAVAGLDHFLCYKAKSAKGEPKFQRLEVDLDDQFGATVKTVKKPKFLCTPVDKTGEGVIDPASHLVCYEVKRLRGQPKFQKRDVLVFNQFEDEVEGRILTIKKPRILCVPSTKQDLGVVGDDKDKDRDKDDDDDDDDDNDD